MKKLEKVGLNAVLLTSGQCAIYFLSTKFNESGSFFDWSSMHKIIYGVFALIVLCLSLMLIFSKK